MTPQQTEALTSLCERYHSTFDPSKFHPQFDLPSPEWVAGWVGPSIHGKPGTIYVGVSPEGYIHS